MNTARVTTIAMLVLGCTRTRAADVDAADGVTRDASVVVSDVPSVAPPAPSPDPLSGEWERTTEPYAGMRVAIGAGAPMRAVVTLAPPVTTERVTPALTRAHLECQKSLWKNGEELVSGIVPSKEGGFDATILVRDWGLTGVCRHADSRAPARLEINPGNRDELTIAVARGKVVAQRWIRVRP